MYYVFYIKYTSGRESSHHVGATAKSAEIDWLRRAIKAKLVHSYTYQKVREAK